MAPSTVTVIVPTRDRGERVVGAARAILAADPELAQLRIVDQSDDRRTREAVRPLLADPRVAYVASETRGLTRALNEGVAAAESELVAITGDDCEVHAGWLAAMAAAFAREPRVAVVFGSVRAGGHDAAAGFVQAYPSARLARAQRPHQMARLGGTSACMGIRRDVWRALGGFDPALGVGAPLQAAEELDFGLRALRAGWVVREDPACAVTHHGFLPWDALAALVQRNWFGTGAAVAKLARLEPAEGARLAAGLAARWLGAAGGVAGSLGRPTRLPRLAAFARGFAAGLRRPLDRQSGLFRPDPDDGSSRH